jgi:hypothetical protein
MDWLTFVVVDPVKAMLIKVWGYIPSIAGAIVILVIGWFIAKLGDKTYPFGAYRRRNLLDRHISGNRDSIGNTQSDRCR